MCRLIKVDAKRHIGHELRDLRLAAGLSQEQLALAIGSHQANVSRMEAGKRMPMWSTVAAIVDACHATLTYEGTR